jgi:transposase
MLSFAGSLRVFVALEACDMRKGFDGLHALVTERLGRIPRRARCLHSPTGGARGSKFSAGTARVCGC